MTASIERIQIMKASWQASTARHEKLRQIDTILVSTAPLK